MTRPSPKSTWTVTSFCVWVNPDIPVADIVVIAGLHDLVALTEDTLAARSLSLIKSRRIYGISKDFVQSVDSRLGFLPIGG